MYLHNLFLYFFILFIFGACNPKKDNSDNVSNKHQSYKAETLQIRDSIKSIKSKINFRNHPYESYQKLLLLEQEVNNSKSKNHLSIKLYIEYGKTLLDAGRSQDAIDVFEDILTKIPENKIINDITRNLHEILAISYMRLGEQKNCIENHSSESCLFPIKGKGIHINKLGSLSAIKIYKNILKVYPHDFRSMWLMNIAYMTLDLYPDKVPSQYLIPQKLFESEFKINNYENISMSVGLDINNLAGGIILDDFNNDGYIDVMASSWGLYGNIRFFKNNGDGTFSEHTKTSGLDGLTGGLNMIQADYNNDGFLDFYVMRSAWSGFKSMGQLPNSLIKNNGDGTFTDVTISSGMYDINPTQSSIWIDFNLDGWLDLFVGNETHHESEKNPSQLFLNLKNGSFKDIAPDIGMNFTGLIKGVTSGDVDNNGLPDIYISYLSQPNKLLLNKGGESAEKWVFQDISNETGVEEPVESFPTWFFDYNNDGWDDLFVSSYDQYSFHQASWETSADYLNEKVNASFPRLYKNNGKLSFTNVTKETSLEKVLVTMGCNFGDIDNDGFQDFYLGTGSPDFRDIIPNRMFRNNKGVKFQDVTYAGNFGSIQKGHGIGFADLDNDGDQDIYAVMGGAKSGDVFQNALFENPGNEFNWINISLTGTKSNRSAIGARIKLTIQDKDGLNRNIFRTINSGGSFGSNSLQAEIGLGNALKILKIEIQWPNGSKVYIDYGSASLNNFIKITEGNFNIEILERKKINFIKMSHSTHQMN